MTAYVTTAAGRTFQLPVPLSWELNYTAGVPSDSFWVRCPWQAGQGTDPAEWVRFSAAEAGETVFSGVVDECEVNQGAEGQLGDVVPLLQHVDRDQGGLPVVAVDDVRGPAEVARRLDDGPGEVGKALTVIKVAVQLPAFEVILIVHEPVGDAVLLQGEDTAVHVPPRQSDVVILLELHLAAPLFSDPLIQR